MSVHSQYSTHNPKYNPSSATSKPFKNGLRAGSTKDRAHSTWVGAYIQISAPIRQNSARNRHSSAPFLQKNLETSTSSQKQLRFWLYFFYSPYLFCISSDCIITWKISWISNINNAFSQPFFLLHIHFFNFFVRIYIICEVL